MFSGILLVLTFVAVAFVAGNNLSACVGPVVGSRIISMRFGAFVGALGFSAGLLLQGSSMERSVAILLPTTSATLRSEALLVSIVLFVFATVLRVPLSLNMSLVGMLAGFSSARSGMSSGGYLLEVTIVWLLAPLAAVVLAYGLLKLLTRNWSKDLWRRLQTYKLLLIILSFSSAYVLGANTLGLIVSTGGFSMVSAFAAVAAAFTGSFLLGKGAVRRLSKEFYLMRYTNATATLLSSTILVEMATFLNIPLSNTQTTTAATFGTGLSYKKKFVSLKPLLIILAGWVAAPLLSFGIGFLLG